MHVPRILLSLALATLLATPVWAQGAPQAPLLGRAISLTELGFDDGVQFTGMGGRRDFFFPVPRGGATRDLMLRLAYDTGSAFESRRSLQVAVGERIVFTGALPREHDAGVIDIPIPAGLIDGPFLRLSLRYAGVVSDNRCVDQRLTGDYFTVLPATTLAMTAARDAFGDIRSVAALMPRNVTILLPDRALTEDETASALKLAAVFGADRRDIDFAGIGEAARALKAVDAPAWTRGLVAIGKAEDLKPLLGNAQMADTGRLSVLLLPSGPALWVGSQQAAGFLASEWRGLAAGARLSPEAAAASIPRDRLTFDRMNATLAPQDVLGRTTFDASFSLADLPAGMAPKSLDLDLAIAEDASGESATVAAFLNDRLLGSTQSDGNVPTRFSVAIPDGLVGQDNAVRIAVQRMPRGGDCSALPVGSPAQLLPSSALVLKAADDRPQDFFALVPRFKSGVTVTLPSGEPQALSQLLPLVMPLMAGLVAADAPVTVRYGAPTLDGNFIAVADALPAGTKTPISFEKGRMALTNRQDKPLFDIDAQARMATVQLVTADKAAGVWIRPGNEPIAPAERPLRLDRGNVAFIDEGGIALAFSTLRDQLIQVSYPDRVSWLGLAQQYRPWIVGAIWIALSIGFIILLQRMYRRRKSE